MDIAYALLQVERREGVQCVSVEEMLSLLDKRATAVMRKCATHGLDPQSTELLRGRLIEIDELTNALRQQQCLSSVTC